ncbi:MAG: precorrin-4 C(11)-methyltransferase [Nitrospina sp.]|jgi:precorrin-4/cobalt-precorrin-4 C11-methyltransferase|nr:precorrin-4 C(11)-methyltransferase [Nitrospina sp.]
MKVYFIGAGPGDVDLITVKGDKCLRSCNYVMYAGSLVNSEFTKNLPNSVKVYDTSKLDLEEQISIYQEAKGAGQDVARLQSGDLSIYGAIAEQMRALDNLEIEYQIIPGVSSMAASAATLKRELTLPDISQTIILTRVSGRTKVPEDEELEKLASHKCTLCIFLSILKMDVITEKLLKHYSPDTPVAVVYKASWPEEKIIYGTLTTIAEKMKEEKITLSALIIVGAVLRPGDFKDSQLYSKEFSHLFRKKSV